VNDDLVDNSYAGKVNGGRYIPTTSGHTGITYDFEHPSAHCCLGLSISENLQFRTEHNIDVLVEAAEASVDEYIANQGKQYLLKLTKVYKDDNCCICLCENPDTVIYQCGHQCCHGSCLMENQEFSDKCPLCRNHITAKVMIASST
jgi:hypothetical protein